MNAQPPRRTPATRRRATLPDTPARPIDGRKRVVVERVLPAIDGGRFPVKRTTGEAVAVRAHVHADGHDVIVVRLRHRRASADPAPWHDLPMEPLGNDEWAGSFITGPPGFEEYTVEGWIDHFLSWRRDLGIKLAAGQAVESELLEGAALVEAAARRCRQRETSLASRRTADARSQATALRSDGEALDRAAAVVGGSAESELRAAAALSSDLQMLMSRHADHSLVSSFDRVLTVRVDRERARFSAWYEMFPRSWGPSPDRSATLGEAARHLPNVAALGFDVVYLPPVHPIGRSFRKGRGNALQAGPNDPGSPWAIGAAEGGHKAVEPGLGTIDDFDGFVAAAAEAGLEVALDIAFQCSPDHPYVAAHPEWFRRRPDGTIKYAENPPKKYQDIYPFDFESPDWQALWDELLSVFQFWIGHGVRIFRVDNPHTKPHRFWEWLIAAVHRDHSDVIFLSEAFTRPKVMGYLAKVGFTQSYSYFTWRNTKAEIESYFTELTTTEVAEYLRPNLFANTPDILHAYLQTGGPAAFRTRLVLAATLGANYGIYSGFELCEGRGVPNSEEYLDSEKYQIRQWDWDRPGHIKDLVAAVNRVRRENTALHFDRGLEFHPTDNPALIAYTKVSPDGTSRILVVVNLDPHHMQHGWITVPAARLGSITSGPFVARDLLTEMAFTWSGERHYVRLDPVWASAHIIQADPVPEGGRA